MHGATSGLPHSSPQRGGASRVDPQALRPRPAGFPECVRCPYWTRGTPAVCFACASAPATPLVGPACRLCGQQLDGGVCPNAVCGLPDPLFSRLHTVLERPEEMWAAIWAYKYDEDKRWAELLARLLVGFLDEHEAELAPYDAITTCALYVGPQANRLWDHLRLVLDAADRLGPSWPFEPDLIHKAGPTGRFLGISPSERQHIAEGELRAALSVPEPDRVRGRRVLVLDDVYSEGYSMREMARVLTEAGAAEVAGLVFARRKGG